MATQLDQKLNSVSLITQGVQGLLDAFAELEAADERAVAQDLANQLTDSDLADTAHGYTTKADLVAAIQSFRTVRDFMENNFHHHNFWKVLP